MIRWITKKRQGELATFTMVYVLLFLVATVAFALQIREYISLKTHTEDTLAASNLASAVIDIQEYGINHNLVIKDPEQAYSIYQEALKIDRKSTRLNSSHDQISYAVFCLKKKKKKFSLGDA